MISNLPIETQIAIIKFAKTLVGNLVIQSMNQTGNKITLIESCIEGADDFGGSFQTAENDIYYTRNLSGYINSNANNRIPGDELDSSTLGSLIAHEIGHTITALFALSQKPIPVYTKSDQAKEELRATAVFENEFRKYYNMPLRKSYLKKDDVLNYSLNNNKVEK